MLYWIVFLSTLFNFTYGILLPVIPRLGLEAAGVAFSSFTLIKILCIIPCGLVADRIGHWKGLSLALLLQVSGLLIIWQMPEYVWLGRGFEGLALAMAQVAAISLCRVTEKTKEAFARAISLIMGVGSIGYILGPMTGFFLIEKGVFYPVVVAAGITFVVLILHLTLQKVLGVPSVTEAAKDEESEHFFWRDKIWFMVALGCGKALSVGMEPLFAWWTTEVFHLAPVWSGFSFVIMAVAFGVGNFFPRVWLASVSMVCVVFLEMSLAGQGAMWWPALFAIGYWAGTIMTLSVSELGWNKPETIGRANSIWLVLTDMPMAFTPVLIWELRNPADLLGRGIFEVVFVGTATFSLIWGLRILARKKMGSAGARSQ